METERIGLLLPEVYRRAAAPGSPLTSLLEVMSQLHAPVEHVVATFPSVLDPWRTPDRFVPFLARWVGLDGWLDEDEEISTGHGRLRVLVAEASDIARLRGTASGLRLALSLALGVADVSVTDEVVGADGALLPFHVRVTIPAVAADHLDLVRRIVGEEKAAHAVVEVVVAGGGAPAQDPEAGVPAEAPEAGAPAPAGEASASQPAEEVPPAPAPDRPPSFPPERPMRRPDTGAGGEG